MPELLPLFHRGCTSRRRLKRPGVSGVCTFTSARWRPCAQRMRWPNRTMVLRELTESRSRPLSHKARRLCSGQLQGRADWAHLPATPSAKAGDTEGRGQSPRAFDSGDPLSSLSSRRISSRDRLDIGPSGQHMTRSSESLGAIVQRKTRVLDFDLRAIEADGRLAYAATAKAMHAPNGIYFEFIAFAGFPATLSPPGTSRTTTDPAPTMAFAPMEIPGITIAPVPINPAVPQRTFPAK